MDSSLAQALSAVDLEEGRTYRVLVRDRWVEVRVLDRLSAPEVADEGPIEPWVELPAPSPFRRVRARTVPPTLPDPPDIPPDEVV